MKMSKDPTELTKSAKTKPTKRRIKRKKYKRIVRQASEGLVSTVADLVLFQCFFLGASIGKSASPPDIWRDYNEASDALEEIDYKTFYNAFYRLKRKGLIESFKDEAYFKPQITKQGRQRLQEIVPQYKEKRPWNKRVYLVTYDVSEERSHLRDQLREMLKRIDCAYLQDSVWLTPYNPSEILKDFVEEKNLHGAIIISDTGSDGAVGNKSLKELVCDIYDLDELNDRYKDFLREFSGRKNKASVDTVASHYLSILADDPQLPFELLSTDWRGDEAYELYEEICI